MNEDINVEFLTTVKDTRNYLTHRDNKPVNLLEGEKLDEAAIKLKLLLELCLLQEIGFKIEEIIVMFRKHGGDYGKFFENNI